MANLNKNCKSYRQFTGVNVFCGTPCIFFIFIHVMYLKIPKKWFSIIRGRCLRHTAVQRCVRSHKQVPGSCLDLYCRPTWCKQVQVQIRFSFVKSTVQAETNGFCFNLWTYTVWFNLSKQSEPLLFKLHVLLLLLGSSNFIHKLKGPKNMYNKLAEIYSLLAIVPHCSHMYLTALICT